MDWSPSSWRSFEARQQPTYADAEALAATTRELAAYPPLVQPDEVGKLRSALTEAQAGRAFLLQGGDCAESFAEFSPPTIAGSVGLVNAMSERIASASGLPVVRVGRIAGAGAGVSEAELGERYDSHCDPRLNPAQARELADLTGCLLGRRGPGATVGRCSIA